MEWRRDTFSVGGACAGRMYIVGIDADAHDGFESCKGIAAFRPPSFVRRQVAGNDMRKWSRPREGAKVSAATQVGVHIDHLFLTKVRVPVGGVFVCWARRMAAIAAALCVHNIASQSHQLSVLPQEVQRNRRDLKSSMNLCFFPFVIVVVVGSYVSRTIHHSRGNDRNKCCDYSRGFNK